MPVYYDSQKIIPAPAITISREFTRTDDQQILGTLFNITVKGTLLAYQGSPTSSGTLWTGTGSPPNENIPSNQRLKSILKKQEAMRRLFKNEGRTFEIQPLDGSQSTKCNPRINNITFEGTDSYNVNWYEKLDYTIELEADCLYGPLMPSGEFGCANNRISGLTEEWTIEFGDIENSFRLTHNVSAVGKRFYDETGTLTQAAWKNARDVVQPRLGISNDRIYASGVLNLDTNIYAGYNHVRNENVGITTGNYGVTETWIISSGNYLEDFTVTTNSDTLNGTTQVSIAGTITGLDTRDSNFQKTTTKWEAASSRWTTVQPLLFARAAAYSGESLNVAPTNSSIGRNPITGVINYTYDYDDRATTCVANAVSESINVTDNYAGDIFAEIPILGRAAGPILQDISTVTSTSRQLSIELVMPKTDTCSVSAGLAAKPNTSSIVNSVEPSATQVFKQSDSESWDWKTGRYTRNVTWVYQ